MNQSLLFLGFLLLTLVIFLGCQATAGSKQPLSEPHSVEHFQNPPGSFESSFSFSHLWFFASRPFMNLWWPRIPADHSVPPAEAWQHFQAFQNKDSITWVGHMTTVVRMNGKVILTDPWFTKYASPLPPLGPARDVPPGIQLADLPQVDAVVISHNHYDHLDILTLEKLPNPEQITVIVPLKVSKYFDHIPFKKVVELNWHEYFMLDDVRFTAVPAVHWSKRTLSDTNKTLWAGWILDSGQHKVYYSEGDYGEVYRQIGERYGPIDYAMLSVGAYLPRGMMHGSHCIPENCLQLGLDIQAQTMIPMHWGTVRLGTEGLLVPGQAFLNAAKALNVEDRVKLLRVGETLGM